MIASFIAASFVVMIAVLYTRMVIESSMHTHAYMTFPMPDKMPTSNM